MAAYISDAARWAAVQSRDIGADGAFVYCVRTTRIYCRPICKARLARRSNVSFRTTPTDAEQAGYRACRRCRPERAGKIPDEEAVHKIKCFVANAQTSTNKSTRSLQTLESGQKNEICTNSSVHGPSICTPRNLREMAEQTGLSKWHFHRVFKKVVGMTPKEWTEHIASTESDTVCPSDRAPGEELSAFEWDVLSGSMPDIDDLSWLEEDFGSDILLDSTYSTSMDFGIQAQPNPPLGSPTRPIVSYSIRPAAGRLLLVVFYAGFISTVGQAQTEVELLRLLHERFPPFTFMHRPLLAKSSPEAESDKDLTMAEGDRPTDDDRMSTRVEALIGLLEKPI